MNTEQAIKSLIESGLYLYTIYGFDIALLTVTAPSAIVAIQRAAKELKTESKFLFAELIDLA